MGSRTSTPIEVLYAETGITPFRQRRSWLAANYLLKLSQNTNNSVYPSIFKLFHNPIDWPARSVPCVFYDLQTLQRLNLNLFTTHPEDLRPVMTARPPSEPPLCDTLWFSLSKRQAVSNRSLVGSYFRALTDSLPPSAISVFTDGSLSQGRTACSVTVPQLDISQSWLLTKRSSVFSAELFGISQALKIIYELDTSPEEIFVFSDSKAAIQAVTSPLPPTNFAIHEIHNLLRCLKAVGTKVTLTWIPSHTGIPGNEMADKLALDECTSPSGNKLNNKLSTAEKLAIFRTSWMEDWLHNMKKCRKPTVQLRQGTKRIDWHFSSNRKITVCLHRLRSGHNYLNAFAFRIDNNADPSCRRGCEAIENTEHVLLDCTAFVEHRRKISHFFSSNNLDLNIFSLLGLDPDIPKPVQFKIRNLLTHYLLKTGLVYII